MKKNNKLIELPSNKSFGILFFFVFFVIGILPALNHGKILFWSIVVASIFLILGINNSKFLTPLNKIWMKFGFILGNLISPLIMGVIYYGIVTPTAILMRFLKKDILNLKKSKNKTYWIEKDNSKNNMRNQF